jgi:hypothetical protein
VVKEVIVHQRRSGVSPHSLMWIIWRERNARCFEDQQRSLEELKKLFIQTLFHWADAFQVSQFSTMPQFVFMFLFLPLWGLSLYTSCVLGLHPSTLFNELLISQKKKKKRESRHHLPHYNTSWIARGPLTSI